MEVLNASELEALRLFSTPTISNALERLGLPAADQNYTDETIYCIFPDLGTIVGYACTATIRSKEPCRVSPFPSRKPYWDYVLSCPLPRIAVMQDVDQPPRGAYWGEVNSNIHRALGCIGLVTDGAVRDLNEVELLRFPFYARAISVSHAWCHLEEFGRPVTVGGMIVRPGDLIHADRHGALVIPSELADRVQSAARAVEDYERPIIQLSKSPEFSTAKLEELMKAEGV